MPSENLEFLQGCEEKYNDSKISTSQIYLVEKTTLISKSKYVSLRTQANILYKIIVSRKSLNKKNLKQKIK